MHFHHSSVGKESACNSGDPSSIPGSGKSTGEGIGYPLQYSWASLVVQLVKNSPAMWEIWVQSLGWDDPLEKGKLPTQVFWPRELHGLYSPWGPKESDITEPLSLWLFLICVQFSQEAGKVAWYSHLFKNFPVCCDPQNQRLYCSQWDRCFSGTSLLSLWSSECWQFDLWFLCLF